MDITLTAGSTTKTLTLARDENNTPLWKSYEVSQDSGSQDIPLWSQTDWSGGFGQGDYSDPTRFSISNGVDVSQQGQLYLAPKVERATISGHVLDYRPTGFTFYANSEIYLITGYGGVYRWDTTNSYWRSSYAGTGSWVGRVNIVTHNGKLYAARGESSAYAYNTGTDTWAAVTGYYASGFVSSPPYAGSTPVLWRFNTPNTISSSEDPTDGDEWSTSAYIGESSSYINSLFIHQGQLFIGKEDGIYHYDSDGAVHQLIHASMDPHFKSRYFQSIAYLNGATYFNMGTDIGELTGYNSIDTIGPFRDASNVTYKEMICTSISSDGTALYASYYNAGSVTVEIWRGMPQTTSDGSSRWAWSKLTLLSGPVAGPLFYAHTPYSGNINHPRLWIGTYTGVSYMIISQNPTDSTTYFMDSPTFTSSGTLETGWIDMGHRDWTKVIDSVLAEAKMSSGDMSATKYVKLYYTTDDSSTYTAIDTAITTATMGTKKYVDTAPITAKKVKFKIELATDSSSVTPVVKYFACYGSVRPPRKQLFDFTVMCETGFSGKAKDLRDFLLACRDAGDSGTYSSSTYLTLTDMYGTSHYVRFLPGYPTEMVNITSDYGQPGMVMRVVCEKVDWS